MVRKQSQGTLAAWLKKVADCTCPELRGFAEGLRQDEAAVQAGLREQWSNGPVEGQVNRLKMIKRQMYGRAGLPLLRARVLHGSGVNGILPPARAGPVSPKVRENPFWTRVSTRGRPCPPRRPGEAQAQLRHAVGNPGALSMIPTRSRPGADACTGPARPLRFGWSRIRNQRLFLSELLLPPTTTFTTTSGRYFYHKSLSLLVLLCLVLHGLARKACLP